MDETGHTFRARFGTTWARRGRPPVLRRLSQRREVSSIVALVAPLIVVWDRLNAHRAKLVQAVVAAHPDDYQLEWLPPYAPGLNPEELCNGAVKRELLNALPASIAELHHQARRAFIRLGHRPSHLHAFFAHAGLSVPRVQ